MLTLFKSRKTKAREALEGLLQDYELPVFPSKVMDILSLLRDPQVYMSKLSEHIGADPSLHVLVLKAANSASFGFSRKISNLHHAVTLMGRSRLEAIILSQAVKDSCPVVSLSNFNMSRFWRLASIRAALASAVAQQLHPATQIESFTVGLLQDMALPILISLNQDAYVDLLDEWNANYGTHLNELEKERLGYDHATAGALLAEGWNFPESLVDAISRHHDRAEDVQVEPAVRFVSHVRDIEDDEHKNLMLKLGQSELGLGQDRMSAVLTNASAEAAELAGLLG